MIASGSDPFVRGASPGQFLLTGVPTVPGFYSVILRAQDSAATPNVGVRTITITVTSAAVFTTALPDASVGTAYSQTLFAFDSGGPTVWSLAVNSAMPPGLSLAGSGAITGTPTQAGLFSFTLNLTGSSGSVARTYTLNVSAITTQDGGILPIAVVGTPYSRTLTATGGASNVLWSSTGMPPGLALSSLGAITGTPLSSGTFTLFITATDGVRRILRVFTLPIRLPIPPLVDITLNSTRLSDFVMGANSFVTLNAVGGVPPYTWRVASGSRLPPGLQLLSATAFSPTFGPGTVLLAGMPTVAGTYTFDLIATDSAGIEGRRTYTVNVTRLALLSGTIPTAIAGTAFSTRFAATGGTIPYTFTMSPVNATQDMLPPGFTMSSDGQISGTTNSTGSYSFALRVQDSAGNSITRNLTLLVTNPSGLRVLTGNPPDLWIGGGLHGETDLSVNGSSTYTWTHTAGTLPPGLHLVVGNRRSAPDRTGGRADNSWHLHIHLARDRRRECVELRRTCVHRSRGGGADRLPADGSPARARRRRLAVGPRRCGLLVPIQGRRRQAAVQLHSVPGRPAAGGPDAEFNGTPLGNDVAYWPVCCRPSRNRCGGAGLNGPAVGLVIAPAGAKLPLVLGNFDGDLPGASAGLLSHSRFDRFIRTGTGPFTWTVAPATPPAVNALPPGMTLVSGSNGTDSYLAGTPTTPGDYSFELVVADSSAPPQSLRVQMTLSVSRLALTPDSLPPGRAGIPYSQALVPSGGTAPYSVSLYAPSDLPSGLSLSGNLLSGTPVGAGNYLVCVIVTDAAGNSLFKVYRLALDDAIGEAPALAFSPKPIQIYYEIGSPAPAPVPVAVTTTTGAQPFSLSLAGVPPATLSASSGMTNATVNLNLNVTSLGAGTYNGLLAASAPGSANLIDEVPVSLTIARAPGCTFSVSPTVRGAPAAGESRTFTVLAATGCRWTAVPSDPWIAITSGASGTGNGSVGYTVAANPSATERTGTVSINGTVYTITQYGTTCSFTVSPADAQRDGCDGLSIRHRADARGLHV